MKLLFTIVLLSISISGYSQEQNKIIKKMKIAVWDTYLTKKNGVEMHFDILAPEDIKDTAIIYNYGVEYLKSKGLEALSITSKECRFCHVESMRTQWELDIKSKGFYIIEMENCN
jgi:hypothetical protein